MPQKRLVGLHGCGIDKKPVVCDLRWGKTDCWPGQTPTSPKAKLSVAFLAMVLLTYVGKGPALAQTSSEERQLSFSTANLSDGPGMEFQAARKSAPLLGCFSTQDAIAAILSGGQQLPPIPPEFQNPETTVTFRADSQQKIGETYKLKGHVVISYRDMEVRADDATYDHTSGEVVAVGHVTFSDPRSHLEADEGHYNFVTQKGWFANARGFVRSSAVPRRNVMVSQSPFYISAEKLEALGENTYRLDSGKVSLCEDEAKGWSLQARSARLELGDKLVTHGTLFRFLSLPLFYAPVLVSSAEREPRQTGFLIPTIGTSSQKGFTIGDGFFWAINPSVDLLLGVTNYSARGVAPSGRFRARPSETSDIMAEFFSIDDRGFGPDRETKASGESVLVQGGAADLAYGFRGVVDVYYINSQAFQSTWAPSFTQAVSPEVYQNGFLTKNFGAYSANFYVSRDQDFLSTSQAPGNSIIIGQTPSFYFSGVDKQLGSSPFYFAFDTSASGVWRVQPGFSTQGIADRLDLHPVFTLRSKSFWGFHLTPSVGLRVTQYGTSVTVQQNPLTRLLGEFALDLRPPSLEKVLAQPHWGHRFKHVIEPDIRYSLVRVQDPEEIQHVVRIDELDTLAQTNEIEYSLTSTILMRKDAPQDQTDSDEVGSARELLSLRLAQKYYFDPTFGGALVPGELVVFEPTLDLTGFAFAQGRHLSPIVAVLKFEPFSNYDTEVKADISPYSGFLDVGLTSRVRRGPLALSVTDFYVSRTESLITSPPSTPPSQATQFNLLRTLFTFGDINRKGLSGAGGVDYNFVLGIAHNIVGQASYNFGCFGLDFEYQYYNLGTLRRGNSFRIALALANVGTFGNLKARDTLRITY
jgi:LPS-assembly protein